MADERISLSPRETVKRMLEHADDDISFGDIIRQLRILQRIEWVLAEAESAGLPTGGSNQAISNGAERSTPIAFNPAEAPTMRQSRPLYSWRSLAEQPDDRSDSVLGSATWVY